MTKNRVDDRRKAFNKIRARLGLSVNAWANAAGVNEKTLRKFLSNTTNSLREDTAEKLENAAIRLAKSSGHNLDDIIAVDDSTGEQLVWVVGVIGQGGVVSRFNTREQKSGFSDNEQVPFDGTDAAGLYEVRMPPGMPMDGDYLAFELRGFPMLPAQDRWVIYVQRLENIEPDSILGQACVVELPGGTTLFRIVRRGYAPDCFNLESWDGTSFMEDVRIVRAHPFVGTVRPDLAKT